MDFYRFEEILREQRVRRTVPIRLDGRTRLMPDGRTVFVGGYKRLDFNGKPLPSFKKSREPRGRPN